jgi:hypothetical protein
MAVNYAEILSRGNNKVRYNFPKKYRLAPAGASSLGRAHDHLSYRRFFNNWTSIYLEFAGDPASSNCGY